MRWGTIGLGIALLIGTAAAAQDVPVQGRGLSLRASQRSAVHRDARIVLRDPAIAAPFPDPRDGAALVLRGGGAAGQCFVEITLDPTGWRPIRGDGAQFGWRYFDRTRPGGIRRVFLIDGRLYVRARGTDWPCELGAVAQREPVAVELRVGTTRYCAAFDETVLVNETGRFLARSNAAPAACAPTDVTAANLNLVHGLFGECMTTDNCRLPDRITLFFQWVAEAGCPDIVTLQEIWPRSFELIAARLDEIDCPFPYEAVLGSTTLTNDEELLLTRYPVATTEVMPLFPGFRRVLHARIDHPIGPVDVYATHLAAGIDGGNLACQVGICAEECLMAGTPTRRDCQAKQMAEFIDATHDVSTPAIIAGDFNARPDSGVYQEFVGRGWVDSHLVAGNPECDPETGIGCTSGRESEALEEFESTEANVRSRIDYIFVIPPGPGSLCDMTIDSFMDDDGDGTATKIFTDDPNPFAPECGPAPLPICWPSDHEGPQVDVNCR